MLQAKPWCSEIDNETVSGVPGAPCPVDQSQHSGDWKLGRTVWIRRSGSPNSTSHRIRATSNEDSIQKITTINTNTLDFETIDAKQSSIARKSTVLHHTKFSPCYFAVRAVCICIHCTAHVPAMLCNAMWRSSCDSATLFWGYICTFVCYENTCCFTLFLIVMQQRIYVLIIRRSRLRSCNTGSNLSSIPSSIPRHTEYDSGLSGKRVHLTGRSFLLLRVSGIRPQRTARCQRNKLIIQVNTWTC